MTTKYLAIALKNNKPQHVAVAASTTGLAVEVVHDDTDDTSRQALLNALDAIRDHVSVADWPLVNKAAA